MVLYYLIKEIQVIILIYFYDMMLYRVNAMKQKT